MTALALVWDLIARDQASPAFARVAASADRTAASTERAAMATEGAGKRIAGAMVAASKGIALVGVGVAAESVKMAMSFQSLMLLIQTQAGASAAEVKKMSAAVLGLAGSVATAPEKLAVSLYHVESIGLRGAKALDVVRIAAEGAKVGHADLEQTTNALTSTFASGIKGVSNMSQAMGMLNATVGAGDMKMQDLNEALGSGVLTVVKQYGVTLRDSGAALAVFGDNNIRGAHAGTMLRMAVQSLAVPAKAGSKILGELGLTSEGSVAGLNKLHLTTTTLSTDLQTGGLNKALHDLAKHLTDAGIKGDQMGTILTTTFGKKAGPGLQVLLGQMTRFDQKFVAVKAGADRFGAAWTATTKTASFMFDQLRTYVEVLAVKIGNYLIPKIMALVNWVKQNKAIFQEIGSVIASVVVTAFRDLGVIVQGVTGFYQEHKKVIAQVATIIGDVLVGAFHTLQAVFTGITSYIGKNKTDFLLLAAGILGVVVAIKAVHTAMAIAARVQAFVAAIQTMVTRVSAAFGSQAAKAKLAAAETASAQDATAVATQASVTRQIAAMAELTAALERVNVAQGRSVLTSVRASQTRAAAAQAEAVAVVEARAAEDRALLAGGGVGGVGGVGGAGGFMGGARTFAGRAAGAGMLYLGGQMAGQMVSGGQTSGGRATAGSMVTGAASGAALGSMLAPGVGTAIGGILGGAYGGISTAKSGHGFWGGAKSIITGDFLNSKPPPRPDTTQSDAVAKSAAAMENLYAQAMLGTTAALKGNRDAIAKNALARTGLVDAGYKVGVTEQDLANGITGSKKTFDALLDSWRAGGPLSTDQQKALQALRDEYNKGIPAAQKYADSQGVALAAEVLHGSELALVSGKLGNFNTMNLSASMAGKVFGVAVDSVTSSVAANGKTLDAATSYGQHNIKAVREGAVAALAHAQAVYTQTGSLGKADTALSTDRAELIRHATQAGLSKDAVKRLVDQIFQVKSKRVGITVATKAALRTVSGFTTFYNGWLASLSNRTIAAPRVVGAVPGGGSGLGGIIGGGASAGVSTGPSGNGRAFATGGLFSGIGTGTSDSNIARLSHREFIVNAAQTAKNLPLLYAINSGTHGYAGGGLVMPSYRSGVLNMPKASPSASARTGPLVNVEHVDMTVDLELIARDAEFRERAGHFG